MLLASFFCIGLTWTDVSQQTLNVATRLKLILRGKVEVFTPNPAKAKFEVNNAFHCKWTTIGLPNIYHNKNTNQ